MKKSRLYLILIVFILGVFAIYLMSRNNTEGTIKRELRDFAVQDTAAVDKIFMVNKANEFATLTREGKSWMVNGKYIVRTDAIDLLLKTLHRVRVKAPVSKAASDNVLKMLATRNTKVEVYSKNKLIKTIYVGGPTQDQMGTYMMLEGSSVPFVVSIPGFVGYLSTRFFLEERDWRSPLIFNNDFDDIAQIKSINNDQPEQSFIVKQNQGKFQMSTLDGQLAPLFDTLAIRFFVSNYEKVASEFFVDELEPSLKDSLAAATPFRVLELTDRAGQVSKVEAFRRHPVGERADLSEPIPEWDAERMYARVNDQHWVVIQYFVFDILFRNFEFFLPVE